MIRISNLTTHFATVHYTPSWIGVLVGRQPRDYEVMRIRVVGAGEQYAWIDLRDNREVRADVACAIGMAQLRMNALERFVANIRSR